MKPEVNDRILRAYRRIDVLKQTKERLIEDLQYFETVIDGHEIEEVKKEIRRGLEVF